MEQLKIGRNLALCLGIAALISASCAKKPRKIVDASGSLDTVYHSSLFLGNAQETGLDGRKIFVIGDQIPGAPGEFIAAAIKNEKPEAFSLVTGSPQGLKNGDQVYFQLSTQSNTLYLLKVGDSYPVAQWDGVGFCKIENAVNAKGEETRYLRADCQDVKNKNDANFINAASASVKTRWIADSSLIATFSKDVLINKPFNINTEEAPAANFIKAAMAKENEAKSQTWFSRLMSLFGEDRAYLSGLKQNVIFQLNQDDVLVMILEGDKDKTPLAQWKVASHCNIVPDRNDWGESTVKAGKECNNEKIVDKSSYAFFSTSLEQVAIEYIPDGELTDLYAKDSFVRIDNGDALVEEMLSKEKVIGSEALSGDFASGSKLAIWQKYLKTAIDFEQENIASSLKHNLAKTEADYFSYYATKKSISDLIKDGREFALLASSGKIALVALLSDQEKAHYQGKSSWEVVASWNVQANCSIENKLNAFGEKEALKVKRCDLGKMDDSYKNRDQMPYLLADFGAVSVRGFNTSWKDQYKVGFLSDIEKQRFTLYTGGYTNTGASGTRAKELIIGEGFDGFNILRPVEFSLNQKFICDKDAKVTGTRTISERDNPSLATLNTIVSADFINSVKLKGIDLLGHPCQEMGFRFKRTPDFLIMQKIVSKEDLAAQEKTFAEPLENGLFAVSFAGIPVSYFFVQPDTEQSMPVNAGLNFVNIPSIEQFTRDNPNAEGVYTSNYAQNTIPFAQPDKLDLFPANFLAEGAEWYYEKTIVDRPFDSLFTSLPFYMELGIQWQGGRVRVHKTKNSVQLVDVNIPIQAIEEAEKDENIGDKMDVMLEIPASWNEYRVETAGSYAHMMEKQLFDGDIAVSEWKERPWVMYEFNRADHMSDSRSDVYKLNTLEIGDDYVNFTVYESTTKLTFKYSLARAKPSRTDGRTYFATDRKKFGYFRNMVNYYPGTTTQYEDVKETFVNVARMYPEPDPTNDNKPTITYHITDNSPADPILESAIDQATEAWNKAFAEAAVGTGKTPVAVKLSKTRVPLGDVRYNKVAFYGYDRASSLLGYGPSVSDPKSGEIYSATNHIYLRNYREGIWRSLSDYIRSEIGQYDKAKLRNLTGVIPEQVLTVKLGISDGNGGDASSNFLTSDFQRFKQAYAAGQDLSGFNRGVPTGDQLYLASLKDIDPRFFDLSVEDSNAKVFKTPMHALMFNFTKNQPLDKGFAAAANTLISKFNPKEYAKAVDHDPKLWRQVQHGLCGYSASSYNTIKEIKRLCDNSNSKAPTFFSYMEKIRAAQANGEAVSHLAAEEEAAFTSCSNILLEKKLIATMVHEFGHNFGLTHNFAASTDINNFPKTEDGKYKFMTASVMDYAGEDDDRGDEPGPYDIASIRYGYYDAIETVSSDNDSAVTLVPLKGRKISEAIAAEAAGQKLKPYKYCWDYDILDFAQMPLSNPDCRRWDRGSNAVELANDIMDQFNSFMITRGHRYDRDSLIDPLTFGYYLMDRTFIPLKILYDYYRFLLNEKTGAKDPYLANIKTEKELDQLVASINDKELTQYHAAAKNIFQFLAKVAFSPINFCVLKNASGAEEYMDFENLRKSIYYESFQSSGIGTIVDDCSDVKSYLAAGKSSVLAGFEFVGDKGNIYNDVSWSPKPDETFDRPDIQIGMKHARAGAWMALAIRFPTNGVASDKTNYSPSMLDQPQLRDALLSNVVYRSSLGEAKANVWEDYNKKGYIPAFFSESKLYERAHLMNLAMAQAPDTTTDRSARSRAIYGRAQDIIAMFGLPIGSAEGEFPTLEDALVAVKQQFNQGKCRGTNITNDIVWMQDSNAVYYIGMACNNDLAYSLINSLQVVESRSQPYIKTAADKTAKGRQLLKIIQTLDTQYRAMLAAPPAEGTTVPTFPEFFMATIGKLVQAGQLSSQDVDVMITFIIDVLGDGSPTPAYKMGIDDPKILTSLFPQLLPILDVYLNDWLEYVKNKVEYNAQEELLKSMIFASDPSNLGRGLGQYLDFLSIITGGGTTLDVYSGPSSWDLDSIGRSLNPANLPQAKFHAAQFRLTQNAEAR